MAVDPRFLDLNGLLGLHKKPRPYKFCAECGDKVLSDACKLLRHYKRHHKDINFDDVKSNGYLVHGELPKNSKYSNFEMFLLDSDTELKVKPSYIFNRVGRP